MEAGAFTPAQVILSLRLKIGLEDYACDDFIILILAIVLVL